MRSYRLAAAFVCSWILVATVAGGAASDRTSSARAELAAYFQEEAANLRRLDETQARQMQALAAFDRAYRQYTKTMSASMARVGGGRPPGISSTGGAQGGSNPIGAAAGGSSQDQLLNATKQMQETQMSFNLQYLQLQNQMQHENRSYTAISNIMKTKHDTAKNSISNVR